MIRSTWATLIAATCISSAALAQGGNPDFRLRASFRTPNDGGWASNQSVGNAEFRVHSRLGHLYYGGVIRLDDYKFTVQVDFRNVSGFATEFDSSMYNSDYDVFINGGFVGRVFMSTQTVGLAELVYDSRHPTPPELPLPADFPEPIDAGDIVSVYFVAGTVPSIGDPAPFGAPVFESELGERYLRGDVNADGKVDEDDYPYLASNYDPYHRLGEHVGPVMGDFTRDNLCDLADYELFAANWTDSHDVPPEPEPVIGPCIADVNQDGSLDFFDVQQFLQQFAGDEPAADLTADGLVDFFDVQAFLNLYAAGC